MKTALITAICLVPIASPAFGQRQVETDTGSLIAVPRRARIPDTTGLSEQERGRIAMTEFARCTVDRKQGKIAAIAALPADKLRHTAFGKVADDDCLTSGQMRFQPMLLRGALFVELYRRRDRTVRRGGAWSLPAVAFDARTPSDTGDSEDAVQFGLLSFANCVVAHDPEAAKAVVLRPTASKEQDAAMTALAPQLGTCLPAGQKLKVSKTILEGALGEILYRGTVPVAPSVSQEAR